MKTQDIQPLSEHRAHLSEHFRQVRETGRPMFVTNNGRTAAVILSPQAYDELTAKAEAAATLDAIDQSMTDIQKGHVTDGRKAMRQIAKKAGIKLRR